jgi:hypothetical protein
VQVVSGIVGGEEMVGLLGIADHAVEVYYGVKVAGGADPGVYGLTVGFAGRAWMVVA